MANRIPCASRVRSIPVWASSAYAKDCARPGSTGGYRGGLNRREDG